MKITRAVVPSLFTVLNIFCGFRAILHTADGDFRHACWFIILAAIFDVLDGIMARITKSSSSFGVEFDSLSDVVSFGAAPSFLVYSLELRTHDGIGMLISAMPMVFGALRLARFNAQLVGYDKEYFKGLPIPAAALTICSFVLTVYNQGLPLGPFESSVLSPMIVILSLLMVSKMKYDTFPRFTRRGIQQHPIRFAVGMIGVTAIVLTRGEGLFPFLIFFVATGPLRYVVRFIQHSLRPPSKEMEEKESEMTSIDI